MGDESSAAAEAPSIAVGVPLIRVADSNHHHYGYFANAFLDRAISGIRDTPDIGYDQTPSRV